MTKKNTGSEDPAKSLRRMLVSLSL
jgi:hypothetical protein